jgi:hypothetical protein
MSKRQITNFKGVKYPSRERNKAAPFLLADEATDSRKIDDVCPNTQIRRESNSAHLVIRGLAQNGLIAEGRRCTFPKGKVRGGWLGISFRF